MQKLLLLSLFILASCNTIQGVKSGAKQDFALARAKVANKIYPEGGLLSPAITSHAYSYCYKSWAEVSCYKEPVKGQENLLVGN